MPTVPRLCALTFDDGPDTAPVMRRAVALGCEIHNHSWSYDGLERKGVNPPSISRRMWMYVE
jgi:hypothetical protein